MTCSIPSMWHRGLLMDSAHPEGAGIGHTWFTLLSGRSWNSVTAWLPFLSSWAYGARLSRET